MVVGGPTWNVERLLSIALGYDHVVQSTKYKLVRYEVRGLNAKFFRAKTAVTKKWITFAIIWSSSICCDLCSRQEDALMMIRCKVYTRYTQT